MDLISKDLNAKENLDRPSAPPWWLALATLAAFVGFYLILHNHELSGGWLEDMPVYKLAVHAFLAGRDPYGPTPTGLHFVYPPIVLYAVSWLARIMPGESEWTLLATIHILCVIATPFVLARYHLRLYWLTPIMAALIFWAEPGFCSVPALTSSNIAPGCYLFALIAAVPGLRKNRWAWFYATVFLLGAVKITFVLLLLFPILAGKRQWWRSIVTVIAVGTLYEAEKWLFPTLYTSYKWALVQQITVQKLYGYGVFGMAAGIEQRLHHNVVGAASYAVQVLFAATFFALLLALKKRGADAFYNSDVSEKISRENASLWLALLIIAVIVINPRVLHYDMYLALFASFVILAITLRLRGWQIVALVPALYLPSLVVLPGIHPWLIHQMYQLTVVLVALAAGVLSLWRRTAKRADIA